MDQIDPTADHPHLRASPTVREWGSLAIVAALMLWVVYSPRSDPSRWAEVLHNSGHGLIFGLVAILLLVAARTHRSFRDWPLGLQCVCAVLGSAGLGLLAEALQRFTHRDPSWMDAINDLVGAIAFVSAFAWFELRYIAGTRARIGRLALASAAIGCVTFLLYPAAVTARAYWYRESTFPVIADFHDRVDDFFLSSGWSALEAITLPPHLAKVSHERSLEVRFVLGKFPGLDFFEPHADWRGYQCLVLDIANPTDEPLAFVLRVHDRQFSGERGDRFNRTLQVAPESRAVLRIALSDIESGAATRKLDMQHISAITLIRRRGSRADRMDVQKVWLE
jgi:hypothetical protein